jgi:hypothetical protein
MLARNADNRWDIYGALTRPFSADCLADSADAPGDVHVLSTTVFGNNPWNGALGAVFLGLIAGAIGLAIPDTWVTWSVLISFSVRHFLVVVAIVMIWQARAVEAVAVSELACRTVGQSSPKPLIAPLVARREGRGDGLPLIQVGGQDHSQPHTHREATSTRIPRADARRTRQRRRRRISR